MNRPYTLIENDSMLLYENEFRLAFRWLEKLLEEVNAASGLIKICWSVLVYRTPLWGQQIQVRLTREDPIAGKTEKRFQVNRHLADGDPEYYLPQPQRMCAEYGFMSDQLQTMLLKEGLFSE